jgi:pimeloyl-ACP methyl ester carboxylesterase
VLQQSASSCDIVRTMFAVCLTRCVRRTVSHLVVVAGMFGAGVHAQSTPEAVTLKAPDGTSLRGTYFSAGRPGPAVLLLPQCDSDRASWAPFAAAAAASGYHVMTLDYRGLGDSAGPRFESLSRQEQEALTTRIWFGDVDLALASLLARRDVDRTRVAAAGASCGATQAARLARRNRDVKTLVLLSGGTAPDVHEFLRQAPWLPVFGIASLDDGPMVRQQRSLLSDSAHPDSRFREVAVGGHGTEMFAAEPQLQAEMLQWFATHLK